MTKWEYKILFSFFEDLALKLKFHGQEGWELSGVVFDNNTYELFFKRPLLQQPLNEIEIEITPEIAADVEKVLAEAKQNLKKAGLS